MLPDDFEFTPKLAEMLGISYLEGQLHGEGIGRAKAQQEIRKTLGLE